MKTGYSIHIIIFYIAAFSTVCAQKGKPVNNRGNCSITYIANEGFLIQTENYKILMDGLFGGIKGDWCDQPSDSISESMVKGIAPFDNIDLVLVSHYHADHLTRKW